MTEQIDPPGTEDPTEDQTMNFYTQSEIPFSYDLGELAEYREDEFRRALMR